MVDRYGSVTAAANVMSYTPPAVSYQLRQLSEQLGVKLVEPAGRGIKLTAAARMVLRHAAAMQAEWEKARSELASSSGEFAGRFTMCGFSTAATHVLPVAAAKLHACYPGLQVRVLESRPARCFELLLLEEADLAMVVVTADSPPLSDPAFDQRVLLDDPLDLVVPAGHPLTAQTTVTLADTALEPWIIGTPGGAYHELTIAECVAAGFSPDVVHQADEWDTGLALVAQGLGVMLVPRLARIHPEWAVVRIRLCGEPVPARRIMAITRQGGSGHPLVVRSLGFAKDVLP